VSDELEMIWKEVVMAQFNILSRHSPRGTEKNQEKLVRIGGFKAEI
jgi:hypothetical protein